MRSRKQAQTDEDKPDPGEYLPGLITDLNTQTRNPSRVSVFIDGTFRFGCYKAVFLESGLRKDQQLTIPDFEKLMRAEEFFKLREYWLDLLSRRAHTGSELSRKALQKGFNADMFDQLLDEFRSKKYIDESAYALAYMQETHKNKRWGPAKIRMELRKRGVPDSVISQAEDEALPDNHQEPMEQLVQKNYKRFLRESDILKRRKKVFDHLVRKGYPPGEVLKHLDHFLKLLNNMD